MRVNVCDRQEAPLRHCPILCWPKGSYIRPSCKRFLTELGNVADITIWSSMRVSTVKSICDLLFEDLLVKPLNILG
jgi:hypothetical protein